MLVAIQHQTSIDFGLRPIVPSELNSCTGGNMSTRTQFHLSIGITAAFMVATMVMPEMADASWWRTRRVPQAPEIDPGTISNAIALAMGGLAVLSDKLRRR